LTHKKIVIAAGGTLGHINPSLEICRELIRKGYNIYYVSLEKNKDYILKSISDIKECLFVNAHGFNRKKLFINILNIIKNSQIKKEIKKFFYKIKPDLIISFGSSVGSLCVSSGASLKIPTVIHEQNTIMGIGNKLVYKKVNKVYLSMECNYQGKIVGNPVITKYFEKYGFNSGDRILIVCGSNGASDINNFFIDNYVMFKNFKITLITGKKYYEMHKDKIEKISNENFLIKDFETEMFERYKEAKIIICRSGSSTLSEVFGLRKLVLTIPSINVSDNHQYYNAKYYYDIGCLEMIEEKELNVENVNKAVNKLVSNNSYYINNIKNKIDVYSLYKFVDEIEKILGGE